MGFGLGLEEAGDTKPTVIHKVGAQVALAPAIVLISRVEDVENGFYPHLPIILVDQVWLAIRTPTTLTRLAGEVRGPDCFDRVVAGMETRALGATSGMAAEDIIELLCKVDFVVLPVAGVVLAARDIIEVFDVETTVLENTRCQHLLGIDH